MASQPSVQWKEIEYILGAQPGPQVHFAQYIINLGPLQGSVISLAPPGRQAIDQLRPRAPARQVLPRPVAGFVDRGPEQHVMGEALARGLVVDLHGAAGTGKTSLLSHAMHRQLSGDYPAGIVYLTVRHDTAEDVLQALVAHFYEAEGRHVKVTQNEVRRLMAGKRALIVLDEANHLEAGDAEAIVQAMPQASFVVAGREPQVSQGQAVALGGLPREEAVTLFEQHLRRALGDERPVAEAICRALDGLTLPIVKAARTAGLLRVPLTQVLEEVRAEGPEPKPVEQLFWMLAHHLSAHEGQVLAALAAPGGPSVSRTALAYISGVAPAELEETLLRLQELELLHVEGERCSLDDGLRLYLVQHAVDDEMHARAAAYYLRYAGTLRIRARHPDEENVVAALAYYRDRGRWRQVLAIVRSLEAYLTTSARWGQWRKRLEDAWQAGRELRDPRTEAWAQNQLGVVALAAGDRIRAAQLFRGALRLWRAINDQTGVAIARWNLQILLETPTPPAGGEPEPVPAGGHRVAMPAIMAVIAATLLIVLVALAGLVHSRGLAPATAVATPAIISVNSGDGYAPSDGEVSSLPTMSVQSSVSAARDAVPGRIDVWLVEGCDRAYLPGEPVEVRAQSGVAGTMDIYIRDAGGRRQSLHRAEMVAGGVTRGRYTIPDREGGWQLEAELDGGRATAACAFAVVLEPEPAPPLIEGVEVQPAMGEPVCPGDTVRLVASISSEPGLRAVTITTRTPDGPESRAAMQHIDDLTYGYQVTAYEKPGLSFLIEAEDVGGRLSRTTEMVYAVEPCAQVVYDPVPTGR